MQFLKHAGITILIIFIFICAIGSTFDSICIEGRIGPEQVKALEGVEWGHCPSYRNGECEAEVDDRVFVGECSETSRSIFLWWKKVAKLFR